MSLNEDQAALKAPGAIEGVGVEVDWEQREVHVIVTLANEDLTAAYFRDLVREVNETGVLRLGAGDMKCRFGEIEEAGR